MSDSEVFYEVPYLTTHVPQPCNTDTDPCLLDVIERIIDVENETRIQDPFMTYHALEELLKIAHSPGKKVDTILDEGDNYGEEDVLGDIDSVIHRVDEYTTKGALILTYKAVRQCIAYARQKEGEKDRQHILSKQARFPMERFSGWWTRQEFHPEDVHGISARKHNYFHSMYAIYRLVNRRPGATILKTLPTNKHLSEALETLFKENGYTPPFKVLQKRYVYHEP